ncbi:glycosyltransferase [Natrialba aegyptia]|uniref:glycosyltransferase n=1 Tax=Natrialba aegyptia TaxID=129789 RepID=UPI00403A87E3
MNYLFFTNTPAHVHLYKHAIRELRERGHEVRILAREYTCTVELLEWYDLPYEVYGSCGTSKGSLLSRLPAHYARAIRLARRFDPDLIFGMGGYAAHTGALLRTPTVLLIDSEPASFDHTISTPFARVVLTPNTFRKDLGDHHYVFAGVKECAYLHPDIYEPNPAVRDRLGLDADEPYAILRLNAFGSQHDVGKSGITGTDRRRIIERLAEDATVLVSDEGGTTNLEGLPARPFDLHPALLHDVLAEAELLVADTQTMVTEAAMLGTPAIRSNSFVGDDDMGNFVELENQGLIRNVSSADGIRAEIDTYLGTDTDETWRTRRDEFLAETVNLTDVIVDVATVDGHVDGLESVRQFGNHRRQEPASSVGVGSD